MRCCRQTSRNFSIKFRRQVFVVLFVHRGEQVWEIFGPLFSTTEISTRSWLRGVLKLKIGFKNSDFWSTLFFSAMLTCSTTVAFSASLTLISLKTFHISKPKKMVWSLFRCGAFDSALGSSANPPVCTSFCWAQASAGSCSGDSDDRDGRKMGFIHRESPALVFLSLALPRNTFRTGTSIIVRAQKIINCTDKTSEQIHPKEKDRDGRWQLSIRKISCYLQACSSAASAVFEAKTGNHQSNIKVVQMLMAGLIAVRVVELKTWDQIF